MTNVHKLVSELQQRIPAEFRGRAPIFKYTMPKDQYIKIATPTLPFDRFYLCVDLRNYSDGPSTVVAFLITRHGKSCTYAIVTGQGRIDVEQIEDGAMSGTVTTFTHRPDDQKLTEQYVDIVNHVLLTINCHHTVEVTEDNRKMNRRGKPVLPKERKFVKSHYVVLDGKQCKDRWRGAPGNGDRVVPHLRRAHLRRLQSGRMIRVANTVVHREDFVWKEHAKTYRVVEFSSTDENRKSE